MSFAPAPPSASASWRRLDDFVLQPEYCSEQQQGKLGAGRKLAAASSSSKRKRNRTQQAEETSSSSPPRRELMSCIEGISVREERQLFAELRRMCFDADETTVLSNGMLAYDFALRYVVGNRMKRHQKMSAGGVRQPAQNVSVEKSMNDDDGRTTARVG